MMLPGIRASRSWTFHRLTGLTGKALVMELKYAPFSPATAIGYVRNTVRPFAVRKSITLLMSGIEEGMLPTITADAARFQQVLYDLLSNAIMVTPEGGRVTVRADIDADSTALRVSVTGSSHETQDTGMDLTLTRRLVELHGGALWVESAGAGKGSTFSFLIPVMPSGGASGSVPNAAFTESGVPPLLGTGGPASLPAGERQVMK